MLKVDVEVRLEPEGEGRLKGNRHIIICFDNNKVYLYNHNVRRGSGHRRG